MKIIYYLLIIVSSAVYGQSEFIVDKNFGVSCGYTFSANDLSNSSSIDGVITLIGSIDLGLQVSKGIADIHQKLETSSTTFYLAYNFKKHNSSLNLKIMLGYINGQVDRQYSSSEINSSGVIAGVGLYPNFIRNNTFFFMGAIEILYGFINVEGDNLTKDTRSISLGLFLGYSLFANFHLVLSPAISIDLVDDDSSLFYGVSGRIVYAFDLTKQ